jgi:oligopeptide/dipeptide ABC transporter ATP-binding protein
VSLLRLDGVSVRYGQVSAVSDVSLAVAEGEIFALVGESGCGKTTLAMSIMGLLPASASLAGTIEFLGRDLTALGEAERAELRGDRISMVFQDPASALDPAFSVGEQIAETIRAHRKVGGREAKARALRLLDEVGIPDAHRRYRDPPHRFSGGMQQRVVIATALANEPALLIADEPTAALDVSVRSQVINLLEDLKETQGLTYILISHDLSVVRHISDRVAVMYLGRIVEIGECEEIFRDPRHPYTQALLAVIPVPDPEVERARARAAIPGEIPSALDPPPGCPFHTRCPLAFDRCWRELPPFVEIRPGHHAACFLAHETTEGEAR